MKAIPNPGTYAAALAGQMTVYYAQSGSLCVAIPVKLLNNEVAWQGKHTVTLVNDKDEAKEKNVATMKEIFGWDESNDFSFFQWEDSDYSAVEFEVVGEHEVYTPPGETEEVLTFKIKWLNPKGGSTKMPEKIDRKEALARFGSKFKAMMGGAKGAPKPTVKSASIASAPAPKSKGPPSRPAGGQPKTSSQQEVWDRIVADNPGIEEDQLGVIYWDEIKKIGKKPGDDLSLVEWGKIATNLGM